MTPKILLVDQEENYRFLLAKILGRAGFDVRHCGCSCDAIHHLDEGDFAYLICDASLPEGGAERLLNELPPEARTRYILLEVVSQPLDGSAGRM